MSQEREPFDCVVKVGEKVLTSDHPYFDGDNSPILFEVGRSYRMKGEIVDEKHYMITDLSVSDNGSDG